MIRVGSTSLACRKGSERAKRAVIGELSSRRMLRESVLSISACLPIVVHVPFKGVTHRRRPGFRRMPGSEPSQPITVKFELNAVECVQAFGRPIIPGLPEGSGGALDFRGAALDMPGESEQVRAAKSATDDRRSFSGRASDDG
jgi:hypothetical protein